MTSTATFPPAFYHNHKPSTTGILSTLHMGAIPACVMRHSTTLQPFDGLVTRSSSLPPD